VFWVLKRVAPSLETRRAGLVDGRHTPTLFALRDLRKDVDLAMALFDGSAAHTPLTHWSRERVEVEAAASPDLDISAVARLYRQGPSLADPAAAVPLVASRWVNAMIAGAVRRRRSCVAARVRSTKLSRRRASRQRGGTGDERI
jgi:hypothetical protein